MKTLIRDAGFVMPMSLFMLGLMSVLVSGYLLLMTSEIQMAKYGLGRSKAYNVAEVGIAKSIEALGGDPSWIGGFSNVEYPQNSGDTYSVAVTKSGEWVTLTSTGVSGGVFNSKIKVTAMVPLTVSTTQKVRIDQWEIL